jgi:ketol-acid reductoisomerase
MYFYTDKDADLSVLKGKVVATIGYGNQGRAQSLNLRDSGITVVIGNTDDSYAEQALEDGFEVLPIAEAVRRGDIIPLLIPDEVQSRVYEVDIAPNLRSGQVLDFAHGYNISYGLISPPSHVDVIMMAPRMIGVNVRRAFEMGGGVPAFVDVWQDASGHAKEIALAFAKGVGATRAGVMQVTFKQETELDLFTEQALFPAVIKAFLTSYEVLVNKGYPPEAVVMELYGSGEASEVFMQMARMGFFRQMGLHSQTSQYGSLTNSERIVPEGLKQNIEGALDRIQSGVFAREFAEEQQQGYPVFKRLKEQALRHPLNGVEDLLRPLLNAAFAAGGHNTTHNAGNLRSEEKSQVVKSI